MLVARDRETGSSRPLTDASGRPSSARSGAADAEPCASRSSEPGFAGLAAADALVAAGVDVIVLEARDRVGGRVWSRELENGAVVELGAEFILPGNDTMRSYVDRFSLGLWDEGDALRRPRAARRDRRRRRRDPERGGG